MRHALFSHLQRMWHEDEGVLSFEWIMLLTLLTIGIVGGIAAARDAIIDELGDVAEAVLNIDQSYTLFGDPNLGIPEVQFTDDGFQYQDGGRSPRLAGQQP